MNQRSVGNTNQRFVEWFSYHSPFPEQSTDLINISNGIVADENINCHRAFEIGFIAAWKIVKLSNKDKAVTMSCSIRSIKCRDKVVEINPLVVFHRICCA